MNIQVDSTTDIQVDQFRTDVIIGLQMPQELLHRGDLVRALTHVVYHHHHNYGITNYYKFPKWYSQLRCLRL
jgi:hypothetical protein